MASAQIQIAREPTACLLDIGGSLVKGQRQTIELRNDPFGIHPIGLGNGVK